MCSVRAIGHSAQCTVPDMCPGGSYPHSQTSVNLLKLGDLQLIDWQGMACGLDRATLTRFAWSHVISLAHMERNTCSNHSAWAK